MRKTRSRKVCMTCHWFQHHARVNCIPVLSCQGWTDDMAGTSGWAPEAVGAARERQGLPASAAWPQEGGFSDGRQVLHFSPVRYCRWSQALEVISGAWIPGEVIPFLKRRQQLTREQALAVPAAVVTGLYPVVGDGVSVKQSVGRGGTNHPMALGFGMLFGSVRCWPISYLQFLGACD